MFEFEVSETAYATGSRFEDLVGVEWCHRAAGILVENNIMDGVVPGKKFGVGFATRAEVVKMITKVMDLYKLDIKLQDLTKDQESELVQARWAVNYFKYALSAGIITGTEQGKLNPNENILKGDVAVIIYRAFKQLGRNIPIENASAVLEQEPKDQNIAIQIDIASPENKGGVEQKPQVESDASGGEPKVCGFKKIILVDSLSRTEEFYPSCL
jgi:hypothetical protein